MNSDSLVEFWSGAELSGRRPFVHKDDREAMTSMGDRVCWKPKNVDDYLKSVRAKSDSDTIFDLSLFPKPYAGNLKKADIVVLLINPGLSYGDYFAETRCRGFRRRLEATLAQDFKREEFPFIWLDPNLCWHPGFMWWEGKLRGVLKRLANGKNLTYYEALRLLSRRLASVELVPYHSGSFRSHRLIDELPSAEAAKAYAKSYLDGEAKAERRLVVVTRRKKEWGLTRRRKHLVLYTAGQARNASLGPGSAGGKKILDKLSTSAC